MRKRKQRKESGESKKELETERKERVSEGKRNKRE